MIVTHDGSFHLDDLLAVCVLQSITDREIVRTRDPEIIGNATYAIDVGGEYDPEVGRFDHHQKSCTEARANGVPYSSIGLVWKEYGQQFCDLILDLETHDFYLFVDRVLIQFVDALDCGAPVPDDPRRCRLFDQIDVYYNYTTDEYDPYTSDDDLFEEALGTIHMLMSRFLKRTHMDYLASEDFVKCFDATPDAKYVFHPRHYDARKCLWDREEYDNILYLISEGEDDYKIVAANASSDPDNMACRIPLSGRGMNKDELNTYYGIDDAIFCHKTGFMMKVGSLTSVYKILEKEFVSQKPVHI